MYIDGYHDKPTNQILIVERDETGTRKFQMFPADYVFYYEDKDGTDLTIYDKPCTKYSARTEKLFNKEKIRCQQVGEIYESDIKPIYRTLENFYKDQPIPTLHIAFFDIEVDFHDEKGFALPEDPFNEITAISIYLDWQDRLVTLVIKPDNLPEDQAKAICNEFDNTYLCDDEADILSIFLDLIEDADIVTGWNSEGFDIPYVVGRLFRILGREYVKKLCHWNLLPKKRTFDRFGKSHETYDLFGRVHLDYLQLYRKYTYHEMHSYSLDTISEYELKERKVAFIGSLDELYKFNFKKFVEYSRQDTMLLWKLEEKLKFISLTNQLAHDNGVLLRDTLGAVKLTDQAIISEAHERGFVVHDRANRAAGWVDDRFPWESNSDFEVQTENEKEDEALKTINNTIAGAYVADPKKGIHEWIGSLDIVSLYPSIIRALNLSPETIFGQLNQKETKKMLFDKMTIGKMTFADAWANVFSTLEADKVFDRSTGEVTIDFEVGKSHKMTGQEAYQLIFQSGEKLCMSANGTIFRTDKDGIIPGLLKKWFIIRKEMQGKAKNIKKELTQEQDLGRIKKLEQEFAFWNQRQEIKKIQLNSLYGAITNPGSRFFDQRMGQSITLTGRNITRHMAAKVNEILTTEYNYTGDCIIYGDTDSAYFSATPVKDRLEGFQFTKESMVELYDELGKAVNQSFLPFMMDRFGCDEEKAKIIQCNREICATRALFVKKKRYAALVYEKEGFRLDTDGPGKLKIMGMETQRADTPGFVQDFLKEILFKTLLENDMDKVMIFIQEFRAEFQSLDPWKMGTPKRCNALTFYSNQMDATDRSGRKIHSNPRLPGHIRAAYNWNKYKIAFGDRRSMNITDGGKTIVCKLKTNPLGITSIAYPIDENNIPQWFKDMPFDKDAMEFTLIDKKIGNLIGELGWDLEKSRMNPILDELFTRE